MDTLDVFPKTFNRLRNLAKLEIPKEEPDIKGFIRDAEEVIPDARNFLSKIFTVLKRLLKNKTVQCIFICGGIIVIILNNRAKNTKKTVPRPSPTFANGEIETTATESYNNYSVDPRATGSSENWKDVKSNLNNELKGIAVVALRAAFDDNVVQALKDASCTALAEIYTFLMSAKTKNTFFVSSCTAIVGVISIISYAKAKNQKRNLPLLSPAITAHESEAKVGVTNINFAKEQPQRHLREGQRAIGICGTWKGGKSSLINGLMGIANSDPRAAFVDQCLETTTEELYEVDEKTVLIELPHTDQEEETPENYFENHRLDQFNLLVFVTGEMVRKKDIEIASIARQNNIDCIFVRSACDRDLKPILDDSEEQDAKKKRLKESGLEKYLPDIEKYSALKGVKCYFVSSCCFYENSSPTNKRAFGLDEDELKKTIFGC